MVRRVIWPDTLQVPVRLSAFSGCINTDVAIVGGGITGLTLALQLLRLGKSFTLIEASNIGAGTTGASTANLYVPVESYYQNILSQFGEETAKLVATSRKTALDFIEQVVDDYAIACNFRRRPWYIFTQDRKKHAFIEQEVKALTQAGVAVQQITEWPCHMKFTFAAKIEQQGHFNPLNYVYALASLLVEQGCQIFAYTPLLAYKRQQDVWELTVPHGRIRAKQLVLATHTPVGIHAVHTKIYPYRSCAIATRLPTQDYPDGVFWHIDPPGCFFSSHPVFDEKLDTLIFAGNHHKTEVLAGLSHWQHEQNLRAYITEHFSHAILRYAWSAQHYQAADGLPYIGLVRYFTPPLYVATGYAADGLIYGTVAGLLLGDLLIGKKNAWAGIYAARRLTVRASFKRLVWENLQVLLRYLQDYPGNAEVQGACELAQGEGKIIEQGGEKWAVYRDKQGKLHQVSALCTHLKCLVKWNDLEKTWDCPCHGSRFAVDGRIIEGPALRPLPKKENPDVDK